MPKDPANSAASASQSSKERILGIAVEEFSTRGFAAARIDEIARRATINKQMIYYYFGKKTELYDAVIEQMIDSSKGVWSSLEGATMREIITLRVSRTADPSFARWRRLLAWEGVEYSARSGRRIHLEEERTAAYRRQADAIRAEQERGAFPAELDPTVLSLLLTITALGPDLLPQVTKMITGREANDPELLEAIKSTLLLIVDAVENATGTQPTG